MTTSPGVPYVYIFISFVFREYATMSTTRSLATPISFREPIIIPADKSQMEKIRKARETAQRDELGRDDVLN